MTASSTWPATTMLKHCASLPHNNLPIEQRWKLCHICKEFLREIPPLLSCNQLRITIDENRQDTKKTGDMYELLIEYYQKITGLSGDL